MMHVPATDGHVPHVNGTNGVSAKPKRAPRYMTDDESANLYVLCLETKKKPTKNDLNALDPLWSALLLKIIETGVSGEASALEWIATRHPERATAIQDAIVAARVRPPEEEDLQGQLDPILANKPWTDMGNGERLAARYGHNFRFVHRWDKPATWDTRRWAIGNHAALMRDAKASAKRMWNELPFIPSDNREAFAKFMKASQNYSRLKNAIALASSENGVSIEDEPMDVFNQDPMLLNVMNGTIELKTGRFREHRRSDLITQLSPVVYDKDAKCPLWLATMQLVFDANPDVIRFWQMVCGFTLTGLTSEQYLPILWGAGENGKSTVLNVLIEMLGRDYATQLAQNFLMAKRQEQHPTEMANLYGKRLVVAVETGEGARINEPLIKQLTGSDMISARRCHEDFWDFKPTHKILLATNHKPAIKGGDHSVWRRLLLIPFTTTISADKRDKRMPEKLRAEYPGILNWCIEGCLAWQEAGQLKAPEAVTEATKEYRAEEDSVGRFLSERTISFPGRETPRIKSSILYNAYIEWCKELNEYPKGSRSFGESIKEKGIQSKPSNGIHYLGLGFRADESLP